jgi:hypothetical protein
MLGHLVKMSATMSTSLTRLNLGTVAIFFYSVALLMRPAQWAMFGISELNKYAMWCIGALLWGITTGLSTVNDALLADSVPTGTFLSDFSQPDRLACVRNLMLLEHATHQGFKFECVAVYFMISSTMLRKLDTLPIWQTLLGCPPPPLSTQQLDRDKG